jgi:hypothetical protein
MTDEGVSPTTGARRGVASALPPVMLPAHPEGEYVALEVALRVLVGGDEDKARRVVQVALTAGWCPPGEIAALVTAARAETAEWIAAAIAAETVQPRFGSWRDDGVAESALHCAARIAQDHARIVRSDQR